jgi:glycerol-3-phosphate acyltransferase PlsY
MIKKIKGFIWWLITFLFVELLGVGFIIAAIWAYDQPKYAIELGAVLSMCATLCIIAPMFTVYEHVDDIIRDLRKRK